MLAAIAEGTSRFQNFSAARDCVSTLDCVKKLGCEWKPPKNGEEHGAIEVHGTGPQLHAPAEVLDCGNSGSTMRMLSGILAGQPFISELSGDESLSRRPMARIMTPLSEMGAQDFVERRWTPSAENSWRSAEGDSLQAGSGECAGEILRAVCRAFRRGRRRWSRSPPHPRSWRNCAASLWGRNRAERECIDRIVGGQRLRAIEAHVPGDLSSAAFFLCAAALFAGSQITLPRNFDESDASAAARYPGADGIEDFGHASGRTSRRIDGTIEARGAAWTGAVRSPARIRRR